MTLKYILSSCLLSLLLVSGSVYAEACSYNEAIMAFKQGNGVRGMALLKMAARDGDARASVLLAKKQQQKAQSLLALDKQDPSR